MKIKVKFNTAILLLISFFSSHVFSQSEEIEMKNSDLERLNTDDDLGLINNLPRLVCAQASNANPLYLSYKSGYKEVQPVSAKETAASAIQIGNPVSIHRAINILQQFGGVVEQATEDELANASGLADQTGLFTCPQTGVALAVLMKLVKAGVIKSSDRTIVISTANGLKFTNFKLDYHRNKLPEVTESKFASSPIE